MEENTLSINETIAKNLIYYRKAAGLTQAELAEKINYSDKSVSKWELGHGLPDVCVLIELANIYGVTLNDLVDDGTPKKNKNAKKGLHALVMSLASGIVWLVATCVFVALMFLQTSVAPWLVFVYAVPVNAIVTLVLSAVWKYKWTHFFSVSAIVWGVIVSLFLRSTTLPFWSIQSSMVVASFQPPGTFAAPLDALKPLFQDFTMRSRLPFTPFSS